MSPQSTPTAPSIWPDAKINESKIELNELVHAISELRRFQEYCPAQPGQTGIERKHLQLLDGISLLLVQSRKSDVVATTYVHKADQIVVYFARNCPDLVPPEYIARVKIKITQLHVGIDQLKAALSITLICLAPCFDKIKQRAIKLWKAFRGLGMIDSQQSSGLETSDSQLIIFVEALFARDEAPNTVELGRSLFKGLKLMLNNIQGGLKVEHRALWAQLLNCAHCVGKSLGFARHPIQEDIRRRTKKLGEYFTASARIVEACLLPEVLPLKDSIIIKQILPPSPVAETVRNPLEVLNHYKSKKDTYLSEEDFQNAFPNVALPQTPIKLTTSVHCELSVIMHLRKQFSPLSGPIEIGVSKYCCHLCETFIQKLNASTSNKIVVSGFQGKLHAGSSFPKETPADLQETILSVLRKELDELRGIACRRRKSDSFSTSNSEDDTNILDREEYASLDLIRELDEG